MNSIKTQTIKTNKTTKTNKNNGLSLAEDIERLPLNVSHMIYDQVTRVPYKNIFDKIEHDNPYAFKIHKALLTNGIDNYIMSFQDTNRFHRGIISYPFEFSISDTDDMTMSLECFKNIPWVGKSTVYRLIINNKDVNILFQFSLTEKECICSQFKVRVSHEQTQNKKQTIEYVIFVLLYHALNVVGKSMKYDLVKDMMEKNDLMPLNVETLKKKPLTYNPTVFLYNFYHKYIPRKFLEESESIPLLKRVWIMINSKENRGRRTNVTKVDPINSRK